MKKIYILLILLGIIPLSSALASDKDDFFVAREYLSGVFAVKKHDYKLASALFADAADKKPDDPLLLKKAYRYMLLAGKHGKAVKYAKQYQKYNKDDDLAQLLLAVYNAREGQFAKASGIAGKIMQRNDNNLILSIEKLFLPFIRIWLIVGEGNSDVALGALDPGDLKGVVSDAFLQLQKALIYSIVKENDKAQEIFEKLVNINGQMPYNLAKSTASFFETTNQWDKAKQVYDKYRLQHPASPNFLASLQRVKQKQTTGLYIKNSVDGLAEVLKEAARLLFSNEIYDDGLAYLQMARMLKPNDQEAIILLASVEEEYGNLQAAIDLYDLIPLDSDFTLSVQVNKAEDLYKMGEKEKASKLLIDLSDNSPDQYIPLVTLADLYRKDREYKKALKLYSKILEIIDKDSSASWAILFARGVCYERIGNWEKAEIDLLAALAKNPNQPEVINHLAYSWIEKSLNLEKAVNMLLKAAASRPQDPQILDSAGWALYKIKDYRNAALFIEKALNISPQDPVMNDHLGDIYWMQGRKYEAKYQWQHALKYTKESPPSIEDLNRKIRYGLTK